MTTGLRVCTVTGATSSVIVRFEQRRHRLRQGDPDRVHQLTGNCRRVVQDDIQPYDRTLRRPQLGCGRGRSDDPGAVGQLARRTGSTTRHHDRARSPTSVSPPARARWSPAPRRPGESCRRVPGTGIGAAMALATSGVATEGSGPRVGPDSAESVVAVVDGVDVEGVSVDGEHPASTVMAPKTAAAVRIRKRAPIVSHQCPACSVPASGSMSFSVRNMKKNTTQPIAAMKIQLISR